ncbi:hypothetical protein BD410DRAFT_470620 [Rickenella mellea]|uniref:RanBP2-type domain-containing protein n=1 Tax=Rickenella mellea TaxID=50990 RepID=A0A4Y7QGK7_9AGAM|nr:hypothetical protein BD410DRAFT_470620 [Rickenella mellea]
MPRGQNRRGVCASPHPLRPGPPPSLPTPSASPSKIISLPQMSTSNTRFLHPNAVDSLEHVMNRVQNLSFSSAPFGPTPPHTPSPFNTIRYLPQSEIYSTSSNTTSTHPIDFSSEIDMAPGYPRTGSNVTSGRGSFEQFRQTKSRVVRVFNLPSSSSATAHALTRIFFFPVGQAQQSNFNSLPSPVRMWTLREDCGGRATGEEDSLWAVFRTHEEACSALSLSGAPLSVATALEVELEPFSKLRKYELRNPQPASCLTDSYRGTLLPPSPTSPYTPSPQLPSATPAMSQVSPVSFDFGNANNSAQAGYSLSSNPPNPKSYFRLGDWICTSANCAAHNFGRNVACIGCGSPRAMNGPPSPSSTTSSYSSGFANRLASPRFAAANAGYQQPPSPSTPMLDPSPSSVHPSLRMPITINAGLPSVMRFAQIQHPIKPPQPSHPILTPSGRAFAAGGKVQNVSSDPLSPCVMYWPDNEPFPEQGQIRPGTVAVTHPPILNTGNRGPIEHQPGDWVCQKCEYLNWRRRKVCQTCYPYAEGNGDSVSAAVQTERIQLLCSVFAQAQLQAPLSPQAFQTRSPGAAFSNLPVSHPVSVNPIPLARRPPTVLSSQSDLDIHSQWATRPRGNLAQSISVENNIVYQTPISAPSPGANASTNPPSGPLLPSFLKNAIDARPRTPSSLSLSSNSSAELSYDDYDDDLPSPASGGPPQTMFYAQQRRGSGCASNSSGSASSLTLVGGNIWAMDHGENKTWVPVALPSPDALVASRSRTSSREVLRPAGFDSTR